MRPNAHPMWAALLFLPCVLFGSLSLAEMKPESINTCLTHPTLSIPSCLIQHSLAIAEKLEDSFDRSITLAEIAEAQVALGKLQSAEKSLARALAATEEVEDDSMRADALQFAAYVLATTGGSRQALATARKIQDDSSRSGALAHIAEAQAANGEMLNALAVAKKIEEDSWQSRAFAEIAKEQAANGELEDALKTVGLIEVDDDRFLSLTEIAKAQAVTGYLRDALKTTEKIDDASRSGALAEVAKALAAMGSLQKA